VGPQTANTTFRSRFWVSFGDKPPSARVLTLQGMQRFAFSGQTDKTVLMWNGQKICYQGTYGSGVWVGVCVFTGIDICQQVDTALQARKPVPASLPP
jgi:hypothetical protein